MDEALEAMAKASYCTLTNYANVLRPGAPFIEWEGLPVEQRRMQLASMRSALDALIALGWRKA